MRISIQFTVLSLLLGTILSEDVEEQTLLKFGPQVRSDIFYFNEKLYYFQNILKGNFFQAMRFCKKIGMRLVSITSEEENDALEQFSKKYYPIRHYLTSGTYVADTNIWIWLSTGAQFSFTKWHKGEPNSLEYEKCLVTNPAEENHKFLWNNVPCDLMYYFICESDAKRDKTDVMWWE